MNATEAHFLTKSAQAHAAAQRNAEIELAKRLVLPGVLENLNRTIRDIANCGRTNVHYFIPNNALLLIESLTKDLTDRGFKVNFCPGISFSLFISWDEI